MSSSEVYDAMLAAMADQGLKPATEHTPAVAGLVIVTPDGAPFMERSLLLLLWDTDAISVSRVFVGEAHRGRGFAGDMLDRLCRAADAGGWAIGIARDSDNEHNDQLDALLTHRGFRAYAPEETSVADCSWGRPAQEGDE